MVCACQRCSESFGAILAVDMRDVFREVTRNVVHDLGVEVFELGFHVIPATLGDVSVRVHHFPVVKLGCA